MAGKEIQWSNHFKNQASSGLTIAEYCKKHKLHTSRWYYWRSRKLKKSKAAPAASSFAQVRVRDSKKEPGILIRLPNGIEVKADADIDSHRLGRIVNFLTGIGA